MEKSRFPETDESGGEEQSQEVKNMLMIFFDIMGIVDKEFILTGGTVNPVYYCDILWRPREDFTPIFGNRRTGCCVTMTHCFTLPSLPILYQKQYDCHPRPPSSPDFTPCNFSLIPQLQIPPF
jgi:hypothetical protein